ncbi:MAG TPA: tripartite tricarboxylate transporter substrate binding protein [Comamonas sp.]
MKQLANSSVSIWRAAVGAVTVAAASLAGLAHAADAYPSKPITLVIPFSPGGSTDILGRLLAQKLSERMNANVVVENKPGANGTIGVDRVAKSAPDGYTIVLADVGGMAISTSLYPKLPYQPLKDLTPVSLVGRSPLVLTVGNNSPLHSLADLNKAAKASPGKLNYPSSGTGGPNHMGGELYAMQAGVKVTHVPYKGSAPSVVSLVSGETDFGFLTAVTINSQLKAGNLRALAVAHDTRLPAMPDVPTMDEAGLKGFTADAWFMAAVPVGTPQPIIDRLHKEIAQILPQEDVKAKLDSVGVLPAGLSPKASSEFLATEITKWREVVKTAKITLD